MPWLSTGTSSARKTRLRARGRVRALRLAAKGVRPDADRLVRGAARSRRAGQADKAVRLARSAIYLEPGHASARRELARALHLTARTPADADEPYELIREGLNEPDPRPVDVRLTIDHAITRVRVGASYDETVGLLDTLATRFAKLSLSQIRRFSSFLTDMGNPNLAGEMLSRLAGDTDNLDYLVTLHGLRIRQRRFDEAAAIVERAEMLCDRDNPLPVWLRVDALLAIKDVEGARLALDQLRPAVDRAQSGRMVAMFRLEGRYDLIVKHLQSTRSGYSPTQRAHLLFDSYWALGDRENASSVLDAVDEADRDDPAHIARFEQLEGPRSSRRRRDAAIERWLAGIEDDATLLNVVRLLADSNRPRAIVSLTDEPREGTQFGPSVQYTRARALYALRRFEEAQQVLAALEGTNHTWTAAKLQARILLEQGDFVAAELNRRAAERPGDGHDEALYHALLAQRRWSEAFAMDPMEEQLRALRATLPTVAERHPEGFVAHRFIVADAGPGDEIQDASLYGEVAKLSERLTVSCDPRLQSIFSRSMPGIDFIGSSRVGPTDFGSHAPDAPARSGSLLSGLLTSEALNRAEQADRVTLGRGVKAVRDLSNGPAPVPAYLGASRENVDRLGQALGPTSRPTIGLVWRSELRDMMRDIHYLEAADLGPLFELGARVVCLQHDPDDEERAILSEIGHDSHTEIAGLDIRNDLEGLAGLLSHLDLVVGIGTTTTNLAAAMGVPTLMMQPTHFGSWLANGPDNTNFWYQSCEVVCANPPHDRALLIRQTADRAADLLNRAR